MGANDALGQGLQSAPKIGYQNNVSKKILGSCNPKYKACMLGCVGRISHTNLKSRMVVSRTATSKKHKELLVPGQI